MIQTSGDGKLFYYHVASNTSQWQMPRELEPVLGEWKEVGDEGSKYWRNAHLGVSSWKDPRCTTNLFQAALDGNLFFLQLYAEVGGFLDAVDGKGRTALHYNCAGGSSQAVLYLLEHGASVNMQDQGGSTPLHWACRYGHAPIVRLLLEAKADPDCQNSLGDTSMHEAAALGLVDPLHWLVQAQANPSLRNRESRTPAEVAERSRATEALALLRQFEGGKEMDESEGFDAATAGAALQKSRSSRSSKSAASTAMEVEHGGIEQASGSEEEDDEPTLALSMVRAARPLLRGVQWLANRVLGEKKVNLGDQNRFQFDQKTAQWVRQEAPAEAEEEEDFSGTSADEGVETWSPPEPRKTRGGRTTCGMESDGNMA